MKKTATRDTARWRALRLKDFTADRNFLYGVRTTGVYCRPICGARLPLRGNVVFFNSSEEAERAGFRACKRCRPADRSQDAGRRELIARACRVITEADEMPALRDLAKGAGLSRFYFQRLFKKEVGLSPRQFGAALRDERVRALLRKGKSVTEAIYAAGFNANSRFYERSGETLGMRPREFRSGGSGAKIRYAMVRTSLGKALIAGTERGICCVHFGGSRSELVEHLRKDFPKAELTAGDEVFQEWVELAVRAIDSGAPARNLPLDLKGTVFQQRVWEALRQIPIGTTKSYTELAQKIGKPAAARAVARACATNSVAVVVPCHRVVRADGDLAGYRWGLKRKRKLLKREAAASARENTD